MTSTAPEPDFVLPSQLSRSPGGTGGDDPGYVPGVDLDQYKRYLLPLPGADPTDLQPWTRVTTIVGMLASQDGLRKWSERNIARGISLRSDLRATLAAQGLLPPSPEDKAVYDEVIGVAKEVTGDGAAARHGRAVHRAVEAWGVTGQMPAVDPAEELGRDTLAAIQCLEDNGIRVRMVERLVVHDVCQYAGRLDALWEVTLPDGRVVLRVGDVKTGKDLHKPEKRHVIGAQEAGYVNATHIYDPASRTFTPMPAELDRTRGYILSVREGTAQLYEIDLIAGWQRMLTGIRLHQDRRASVDMLPIGHPVTIQLTHPPAAEPERQVCPGDPQHYADSHWPGGAWYGVPLDHGLTEEEASAHSTLTPGQAMAGAVDAMLAGAQRVGAIVGQTFAPFQPNASTPGAVAGDAIAQVYAQELATGPDVTAFVQSVGAEHATADVPAPVVETSPSGRKRRACSKCRKPGHTAKNCPGDDMAGTDAGDDQQIRPQPGGNAVDGGAEQAPTVQLQPPTSADDMLAQGRACPGTCNAGWSVPPWAARPDLMVCAGCGLPSAAILEKIRGERAGLTALSQPAASAPAVPAQPLAPVLEDGATVARLDPAPAPISAPPWQAAPVTLMEQLLAVRSQEELGQLWKDNQATWGPEHTAAAQELVSKGLPTLPDGS